MYTFSNVVCSWEILEIANLRKKKNVSKIPFALYFSRTPSLLYYYLPCIEQLSKDTFISLYVYRVIDIYKVWLKLLNRSQFGTPGKKRWGSGVPLSLSLSPESRLWSTISARSSITGIFNIQYRMAIYLLTHYHSLSLSLFFCHHLLHFHSLLFITIRWFVSSLG